MAAFSTIATAAGLALTAAGTTYGVVQGERGASANRQARRAQERAQQQALAAAGAEQRRAAEAERRANRQSPDITSLLLGEQEASRMGAASTMLTGPRGLGNMRLRLGKPSLLGE